jgi:hypothetical protein
MLIDNSRSSPDGNGILAGFRQERYSVQQEKLQKTTIARLLLKNVCLMFKVVFFAMKQIDRKK